MQLELANYDRSATHNDLMRTVFAATQNNFTAVALPPHFAPHALEINKELTIISPVDFPFGMECTNVRLNSINEAFKRGSKIVELMINNSYIYDKKYKNISEDLSSCITLAKAKEIELRAMVEYRLFDEVELVELARKLYTAGIRYITLSTGTMVDDPVDNLIMAAQITKGSKLKVVTNSCFNSKEQVEIAQKSKIYALRFNSAIVVEKLFKDSKNGV